MDISNTPLETKADPLEASFDAVLMAEESENHGKAIAALRTDVDGLKSQMTDISRASARPALAGNADGVKGMLPSAAATDFVSKYLRRGDHTGVELKSFSGASGPEGGFAVPQEIDALIGRTLKDISPIRSIATLVQTGSAGYRKLVTNGGTPSGWVSETAGRPETDTPNFNEIAPPTGELYANPAASQAMLDDAAFDVEAWLADEIAREFAQAEGAAFVGGPLGGALGGLLGQQVDQNILFKPKGVEGPRLQELAVQTSSYGAQIPRIFGKMRVAGTVIWATDLKETRESRGGGKGRPKSTTYSYSACLAVALSSRNIKNIGRIWADGKIFRGSAGDFKTETGFRFYQGHEDQAADGLIASAESAAGTPAYRGLALAVFEDMDLTDYGNRIPSLTFEVIADDGTISLAAIIDDISGQAITASVNETLHGFAAGGQDRRAVLDAISDNFSLSFRSSSSGKIAAKSRELDPGSETVPLGDTILSGRNGQPVDRAETQILPETKLPRQYALRYYEPARDYQSGMQNAFRPGQSRVVLDRDFPAAMHAVQAKKIAQSKLWSLYQERVTAQLNIVRTAQPAKPGAFVQIDDSEDIWLVRNWEFNHGSISLGLTKAASSLPSADRPTDNGRPVKEIDALAGPTRLELVDLPFAIDAPTQVSDSARLYAAAAGDIGWRNAQLFAGGSDNALIGQVSAPAIMGTSLEPLRPSGSHIIDRQNKLLVQMHNRSIILNDADKAQLWAGNNIAAIGAELIQFGFAEPLGDSRYLLSYLLRGLGGTEMEMDRHGEEEDFILLEGAGLTEIDTRHYVPFQPFQISALGRGDEEPVSRSINEPGRALKPWSPVHPRFDFNPQGDLEITWTRRSRAGLMWPDNIEIPLAEETEQYRVVVGTSVMLEPTQPSAVIPADQVQDYRDCGATTLSLEVRQVGRHTISDPLSFAVSI